MCPDGGQSRALQRLGAINWWFRPPFMTPEGGSALLRLPQKGSHYLPTVGHPGNAGENHKPQTKRRRSTMAREHVWQGVVAGIARFAREVDRQEEIMQFIDKGYTEYMVNNIWKFVEPKQSQEVPEEHRWHSRGQSLFAEIYTIGEMSRHLMKEGSLSGEEIDSFVSGMPVWVNSFFHTRL
jgi:hypothetical protein